MGVVGFLVVELFEEAEELVAEASFVFGEAVDGIVFGLEGGGEELAGGEGRGKKG